MRCSLNKGIASLKIIGVLLLSFVGLLIVAVTQPLTSIVVVLKVVSVKYGDIVISHAFISLAMAINHVKPCDFELRLYDALNPLSLLTCIIINAYYGDDLRMELFQPTVVQQGVVKRDFVLDKFALFPFDLGGCMLHEFTTHDSLNNINLLLLGMLWNLCTFVGSPNLLFSEAQSTWFVTLLI